MALPDKTRLPIQFGKYELLEYLGGGMADVYRARDNVLGKTVAVKILKEENNGEANMRARFLDEARTAATCDHENIINVFDYGEHNGLSFMVMEFLRGEDMCAAIQHHHPPDLAGKLKVALQTARALEHIHAQGIVHRDIKPANIHINQSGTAKLIDFGIAKAPDASVKTQTGFAVGTLYYMAPEQVAGKTTKLVDIYAFGLVFYELLCGQRAVPQDSMERTFYRILNEPIDLTPLDEAHVPSTVIDLVRRCTMKPPEQRIQSFTAICNELSALMDRTEQSTVVDLPRVELPSTSAPPAPPPRRKTRLPLFAGIGAGVLLLAGGAAWFALRTKAPVPVEDHAASKLPATLADPAGDMVLVGKGAFFFGPDKKRVDIGDYYIDKTEVTNRAYALYAAAKGQPAPRGTPELPVTDVPIEDARDFCEWAGKRLPTTEQWEKAARGADGRKFPWGDEPDAVRANVKDNPNLQHVLLPADSMAGSASVYGALNMAGNAWEYVQGTQRPHPKSLELFRDRVKPPCSVKGPWVRVRGGSYLAPIDLAVSNDWMEVPECFHAADYGFRCVKLP